MSDKNPTATPSLDKPLDRRTVIQSAGAVGVGVVAIATLAACGGTDSATPGPGKGSAGAGGDAVKVADIPVGGGKIIESTKVVVTQPKAGEFKAFSAVCTHQSCVVATVADGTINCSCHGSKFDIATGQVKEGPATKPLPAKTATVSGDSITIS